MALLAPKAFCTQSCKDCQHRGATLLMVALGKFLPTLLAQPWVAKGLYKRQPSLQTGRRFLTKNHLTAKPL